MEFNALVECTSCNVRKMCNEQVAEIDSTQRVMHFCEECYMEIEDTLKWADEFSKREKLNMQNLKVYKLSDYDWYITPWSLEKTLKWYNKEYQDDVTKDSVEECDIYNEGMWLETNDEDDIQELGDSDEIIGTIKTDKGIKRVAQFGNLMRKDGIVYKFCSFKVVIEGMYDTELIEPEIICSSEW